MEIEGHIGPRGKLLWLSHTKTIMHYTNGNFPYMFDYWTYPVVHILLLKSSTSVN